MREGERRTKSPKTQGNSRGIDRKGIEDKRGRNKGTKDKKGYSKGEKDRGSYDGGSNNRGSSDRGSNNRGSNDRGSNDRGSNNRGSYDRGSIDRGSIDRVNNDRGSKDKRSNYRGSNDIKSKDTLAQRRTSEDKRIGDWKANDRKVNEKVVTDKRNDHKAGSREIGNRKQFDHKGVGQKSTNNSVNRGGSKDNQMMCPYRNKCGGCDIQQDYQRHLSEKQKLVSDLLKKFCKVDTIIGMKNPYHYRNKVHAVFDHDRRGNAISGVYEANSHRVVPVEACLIEDKRADAIIQTIRGLLKSFKIKTYDEDTGFGLLRHVLIRTGFASGEIMVILVLASPIFPSKTNFVKALRQKHPEITTIILNVNDKMTSMVLGEKEQTIFGKGYIEDTLCGKVFRISPKSFYQVNPVQTEVLYQKAIEFAGLKGGETILDAYCGIGTIGLIASDHVKKVIGVELNKDAVRDAVINGKRNQVKNIEIYQNDAGEFMTQLSELKENVEVVFLDPPRAGSDEKFLGSLVTLKPKKVVYISCNPITLERDLQYLTSNGYRAEKAVAVDMFPWTSHVETCVLLTRKNLASYNVEITVDIGV